MGESIKLSDVEIKSFRGIKDYTLETNGKSIVFCGANGTGKSSFVNAFEFLFTGQIESLKGSADIKHDKSIIHIGDKKKDVLVRANINNYHIQRSFKNGLEYDDKLNEVVDDFKNGSFLLNRKKLLKFIDAKPAERWKETTRLIDFDKYDEKEKILEKVHKEYKKQLKLKTEELNSNASEINKFYGGDIDDTYDYVNETLKSNNYDSISPDSDLNKFLQKNYVKSINVDELNISQINDKYQTQLNVFDKISLSELKSVSSLLNILNRSAEYISSNETDMCPVCNNKINSDETLYDIQSRTKKLEKNNFKLKNWQDENHKLIKLLKELNNRIDHDLSDLINNLSKLTNLEITTSEFDRNILSDIEDELQNRNKNTEEVEKAFEIIMLISKRKDLENQIENIQKHFDISKTIAETFSQKKKEIIENIFDEIKSLADEYYEFIHEDDDLKGLNFGVKSSRGITMSIVFGGDASDPRSYASEGHIDSLGLCIFLAFVKRFNRFNFIVLDDIISTVDLEHKERIIRLLLEKFQDFTFIITTHNKLWFEQLKRLTRSYNVQNDFTFLDIKGWDKDDGPLMSRNNTEKKRIERYIEDDDAEAAGNAVRRHLEYVFNEICKLNGIPLPIKPRYTINDYYSPCINHFNKMIKNTDVADYYHPIFAELDNMLYVGNLLSHENEEHYDLQMNEVIRFRDAVFAFENAFKCREHDRFLKFDKERKTATCTQKRCQDILIIKKQG